MPGTKTARGGATTAEAVHDGAATSEAVHDGAATSEAVHGGAATPEAVRDGAATAKATSRAQSGPGTGGRKKVGPKKAMATIRDMVVGALDRAGGEDYLLRLAEEEPKTFMSLVSKVLPMQQDGDAGGPLTINIVRFSGEETP